MKDPIYDDESASDKEISRSKDNRNPTFEIVDALQPNAGSLFESLQNLQIPKHQFLDQESLEYIKTHRPPFQIDPLEQQQIYEMIPDVIESLQEYLPNTQWYLVAQEEHTIHGVRHLLRTMIYILIYIQMNPSADPFFESKTHLSVIAASMHDLRRKNDLLDLEHANRASEWVLANKTEIECHYNRNLSEEDHFILSRIIAYHIVPYEKFEQNDDYKEWHYLIDLLKVADALDRYRLAHVDWWMEDRFLHLIPSATLKAFAFDLVVFSEEAFLNGKNSHESVFQGLTQIIDNNGGEKPL